MNNNQFYLVEYGPAAKGCPYFLSGRLTIREQSEFCEETTIETGETMMHRYFPATLLYAWIKRFSVVPAEAHLFRCLELG
ncbi:hypothetical protein NDK47_11040 [Brevibacillus ruminantium]|uniref:Uncharacterized protein n=1 Tax=Brevibacillus ruminantium TaxID=2950604 RepID=A0ABY4WLX5_9BACL|nr:hypothetical protein [Brevibacillus ruminantium]USG67771.1 hypothetical protein NDK47_11040 [Brevibacillus ruminantium]